MTVEPTPRNASIDRLRGVVMVIMALDHTRDFFGSFSTRATDLTTTTPTLFFTRWITHFCAPVFVFLAGTSAFLSSSRKSRFAVSRHLITRGLWLILLELTVIRFAWQFEIPSHYTILQVIWAIGCSMVAMGLLVFLPRVAIAVFAVVMIVIHNAFDHTEVHGSLHGLWTVLHEGGRLEPLGRRAYVVYPLIPWIGVMALGYVFGAWMKRPSNERKRLVLFAGLTCIATFIVLRATNWYGDPDHWARQRNWLFTVMSFLNCEKYPPSLLYVLMTLGPALCLLAWWDGVEPRWSKPFVVIGRVPLFYYILHLYFIHGLAALIVLHRGGTSAFAQNHGRSLGFGLGAIYLIWAFAVLLLYPASHWFSGVKQRRKDPWLSYL